MKDEEKYGVSPKDGIPISFGEFISLQTHADWAKWYGITGQQWLNRQAKERQIVMMCYPEGEA